MMSPLLSQALGWLISEPGHAETSRELRAIALRYNVLDRETADRMILEALSEPELHERLRQAVETLHPALQLRPEQLAAIGF